jgi:hypothetical protein
MMPSDVVAYVFAPIGVCVSAVWVYRAFRFVRAGWGVDLDTKRPKGERVQWLPPTGDE